jgi:4-amino-4-deoxy-L-arabinose transferase-like glycosyltransferase
MLTRGLLALLFPALTIVLFLFFEKDLKFFKHPGWIFGALLFLVISVPWHVAVELREPGFLKYYFLHNHLGRVLGNYPPGGNESLSLGKFWAISLGGMFPWTFFIPAVVYGTWKKWLGGELDAKVRFVCIWTLAAFISTSLSSARLERYFLPALPGLALWMSYILHDRQKESYRKYLVLFGFGMTFLASLGLSAVLLYLPEIIPEYSRILDVVPGVSIFFLLGSIAACLVWMCGHRTLAWKFFVLCGLCAIFFVNQAVANLSPVLSLKGISRFIQRVINIMKD